MVARNEWRRVTLRELRREPEHFSFSWPGGDDGLRESLGVHGQLRPLLVEETGHGVRLLSGHRRAEALESLGVRSAWARTAETSDLPKLWDLLLQEQGVGRALNPVEIGRYVELRQAATGEPLSDLAGRVCAFLGLPARAGALEDFLWVARLPDRYRDGFAQGRWPVQSVRVLSRVSTDEVAAILGLLGDAPVGVNKLSELARWVQECAWAAGERIDVWIESAGLEGLRGQPEALRRAMRRQRYPQLAAWEASFEEDVRGLPLPSQVRINHPQGFEGGKLSCTLVFGSLDELKVAAARLQAALGAGQLATLGKYLG